ncbi:hypothetical protein ACFPT7_02015 [Acidicapsa dinghuensis]|uniref:DUF2116 family Zn-ribbon domain-containing protein n=1 Tax=Acidicapsa dinghuensis TaxID=2218256 RepID=A0ABW1EAY3_9BACT|nr:hypothetical protein [Acidicapsa dinghuensis]
MGWLSRRPEECGGGAEGAPASAQKEEGGMSHAVVTRYRCSAGCGRAVPGEGMCAKCAEEVAALNAMYFRRGRCDREVARPARAQWIYYAGAAVVFVLFAYFVVQFLTGGN